MEKRALLAFILSMIVFVGWAYLFAPRPPETPVPAPTQAPAPAETARPEPAAPAAQVQAPTPPPQPAPRPAREITVRTDLYTAVFTESGGRLKSLTLHRYQATSAEDSGPMDLITVEDPAEWPLGVYFLGRHVPGLKEALFRAEEDRLDLTGAQRPGRLTLRHQTPAGLEVVKVFTFHPHSYLLDLEVVLRNLSPATLDDNLVLELTSGPFMKQKRFSFAGLGALIDDELREVDLEDLDEDLDDLKTKRYSLTWAGYEDQYFLAAVLPQAPDKTSLRAQALGERGLRLKLLNAPLLMPPRTEKRYHFTLFYGPKDYNLLKSLDKGLERAIYFGWFDILAKPLLVLMIWLHGFVSNYGLVIILVTILIKILFWPLTAKSYKSMKEMQKLQPKLKKLREKYKDDREAMNREMMQLYRTYKVNPMGGCLPMIIQIPVFIALYRLLDYSLELRHAPFCLWIQDLSAPDRLFRFGFSIPFMQDPAGIPVLTLLMGATMFFQQKMTPSPGDPTQAKVMMFMPLFFTVIFINFPAGLVLYWLVNNILSIGQQYFINKRAA